MGMLGNIVSNYSARKNKLTEVSAPSSDMKSRLDSVVSLQFYLM